MKKLKGIVIGVLITVIISSVVAYAAPSMIEVMFNNIKIKINGNEIKSDTEPFIYQNRTYVPIRAVSENLGADVYWDGTTNTVSIQDSSDEKISDYYDSIHLLSYSEGLKSMNSSFCLCNTILGYETRGSYGFNSYYNIFKDTCDTFNYVKSTYANTANIIIKNSNCSANIESANKLLNTITLLEENINLLSDLFVSLDVNKNAKFCDNAVIINSNCNKSKMLIFDYINN